MNCEALVYRRFLVTPAGAPKSVRNLAVLIIKEGPKFLHAVAIDPTVKVVAIPKSERRFMRPLLRKGRPYEARRACRRFLAAGKYLGISKSARAILNALREQTKGAL